MRSVTAPYGPPDPYGAPREYELHPPAGYGPLPPPQQPPPWAPPPWTPGPPPPRNNTALVVVLLIVIVLVVGGGITAALVLPKVLAGKPSATGTADNGADLSAVVDYRKTNPSALAPKHQEGTITYPMDPPAGGPHNPVWMTCTGKVYADPVLKEKAVHSLEHGAVWITYRPGLDAASVDELANRVRGQDYTMLSPYPGQQAAISLQAWGYQLTVDSAGDKRIDAFIRRYRVTASAEPGAPCSGGDT